MPEPAKFGSQSRTLWGGVGRLLMGGRWLLKLFSPPLQDKG